MLIHCKQGLADSGIYQQTAYQPLCARKFGRSPPVPAIGAVQDRCLSAGKDQAAAFLGRGQAGDSGLGRQVACRLPALSMIVAAPNPGS